MNKRITSTRDERRSGSARSGLYRAAVSSTVSRLLAGLVVGGLLAPAEPARAQDMKPKVEEKVKRAAVMVATRTTKDGSPDRVLGSGSGYFINSTGLMISNNHVVDPTHGQPKHKKFEFHYKVGKLAWSIVTDSGTDDQRIWDAVVVYQNEPADQAILQVYEDQALTTKLSTPNYLRLQPESRLKKRMKVWAFGFPGGTTQQFPTGKDRDKQRKLDLPPVTITKGHIIDIPRTPAGRVRRVYTDVIARPGNSGGAMVDSDGFSVGTATLMTPPKGREDTGGANYSALVPTALTADMIRNAFDLGKIEDGSDVTPFMEMLTQDGGRLDIPEFARLSDRDILFFEDGDRIYGDIATDAITWKSPLGELTVPTSAIAYVMNNDEGRHLFLEGGNRITTPEVESSFEFTPDGGTKTTLKFDAFQTVGFRTSDRLLEPVTGKIIIFDSELTRLRLADVQGTVKLEGKLSPIDIKLEEIERINTDDDGRHVVLMTDGRRMTGKFGDGTYKATIASANTPIEFGLSEIKDAHVEVSHQRPDRVAGLGLLGVLADADRDVRRIAENLESGDATEARKEVEAMLSSSEFRKLPDIKKDQFRLVAAVAVLRDGNGEEAAKAFRKCLRAEDLNISAFAKACNAVLRRFDSFAYQGKPLSDRVAFVEAGSVIADEYIQRVRDFLKDAKAFEGEKRTEYIKSIGAAKKNEDAMRIAAVFRGTEADDELIRLWKLAFIACQRELGRIDREIKEKREQGRGSGTGQGAQKRRQRELDELNEQRQEVLETGEAYLMRLYDYGFRIEDPDIQEQHEREDQEDEPDDDDGP